MLALFAPVVVRPAYGYLDPGTGSYILQMLLGVLFGGLFAIGLFWRRVTASVKRLFSRKKKDDTSGG